MKTPAPHRPDTIAAHQAAVEKVVRHMKANLTAWDANLSLKALAREACYSVPHLIETFHGITGTSPAHFLASLRIQKAKELLLSTERSVIEIALEVGYQSPQSFSKKFADFVGTPPVEFRKGHFSLTPFQFKEAALDFVANCLQSSDENFPENMLHGIVKSSHFISGIIFVGLFSKGVPQGRPFSGTVLFQEGIFSLHCPPGQKIFHLLAVVVPSYTLVNQNYSITPMLVARDLISDTREKSTLDLRLPRVTDPPIVFCIDQLLRTYR